MRNDLPPHGGEMHTFVIGFKTLLRAQECLDCLAPLDVAVGEIIGRRPAPGDITICSKCGAALCFGPNMEMERVDFDSISRRLRKKIETTQRQIRGAIAHARKHGIAYEKLG